jgi:hypothetical protein
MLLVQVTSRHGELDGKRLSGYQYSYCSLHSDGRDGTGGTIAIEP